MIFSKDGKYVLSSGEDKGYVWETRTGNVVRTIPMKKPVNCIGFDPTGKYVVSGQSDATVRVWNAMTLAPVKTFTLPQYAAPIRMYIPKTGTSLYTFEGQYILASKESKNFISKWDLKSLTRVSRTEWPHEDFPTDITDDGENFMMMVSSNDPLEFYSTSTFKKTEEISKEDWPLFVDDYMGGNTVIGETRRTKDPNLKDRIVEYNFRTKEITKVYEAAIEEVDDVTLSPGSDLFVFLDEHYKTDILTVVSREAGITVQSTLNLSSAANTVEVHPSKPWISCHTRSAGFTLLDLTKGELIRLDPELQRFAQGAWYSPDGKYMALEVYRKGIVVLDVATLQEKYTIEEKFSFPEPIFSPDSKYMMVNKRKGGGHEGIIYDLATGEEKMRTNASPERFSHSVFLDNERVIIQDEDGFGVFNMADQSYSFKNDKTKKHVETAVVGSSKLPMDFYRPFMNRARNELVAGNRRTMVILDPKTFVVKKKFTWKAPMTEIITSFVPSPDGNYVASGTSLGSIVLWDMNTGTYKTIERAHSTDIQQPLRWTYDSKFLISYADDGGIKFWDPKTRAFKAQYVNTDKEDFLIYTDDNYYYATKGALPFIGFKLKRKIYPYEQFDLKYNRPDKVLQKFAYVSKLKEKMMYLAYKKRLKRLGFTEEKLAGDFHAPEIEVIARNEIPILTESDKLSFKVKTYDSKFPVQSMHIYVNDVPVLGRQGTKKSSAAGKFIEESVDLNLSPGRNRIKVSVKNSQGTESTREGFMVYSTKDQGKPNLYLLTIGVSEYKDSERNLTYAAKDARDLTEQLKKSKAFGEVNSFALLDAEATIENVEAMRAKLDGAREQDLVIVYVSSHGLLDEKLDYFLAMHHTNFEDPAQGGLPYTSLENLLDGIPARNRLVLIDACHSGEIDKDEAELTETVAAAETQTKSFHRFQKRPQGGQAQSRPEKFIRIHEDPFRGMYPRDWARPSFLLPAAMNMPWNPKAGTMGSLPTPS